MNDLPGEMPLLEAVATLLPCAVWAYDSHHRLAFANAAAWQATGVDPARVPLGTPLAEVVTMAAHLGLLGAGDPAALAAAHLRLDRSRPLHRLVRNANGTVQHVSSTPLPGGGFASLALDVTRLVTAGDEAAALARRLEDVLHRLHAGLALYDTDNTLLLNNAAYERLLGLPRGQMPPGTSYPDLLRELARRGEFANMDPEDLLSSRAQIDRRQPHSHQRQRPNGRVLQLESQPVAEGGWLVEVSDITALKRAEDEASGRAALLHGVLEALPLGVMVVGPDMRVRMFNTGCQAFFDGTGLNVGEHREELARRRAAAGHYGPGETEALVAANLTQVNAGPVLRQRIRPDGKVIEVRAAPTPDGGYVQVMADITALHRARAEATERAELLQLMLDSMRHGIALFDGNKRLITANTLAARLMGLPPAALHPGVSLVELRDLQAASGEFGDGVHAAALISISDQHDARQPYRYTRQRPDGTILEIASDPTPGGGFVRTYIDITARAQAEAEARQQAATLQAMIDNLGLGVALFGPDRRLVAANPLSAELGGLPAETVVPGALLDDLARAQLASNVVGNRALAERLTTVALAQDRRLPHRHQRRTDDGRTLEVRSDPMPDGGFVLSHMDITALTRAEAEAEQRASMLQAALDNIRHGIAMFGPDHRLIVANVLAAQVTGLPPGALRPGMSQEEVLRVHATAGFFDQDPDAEAALQVLVRADRSTPRRAQRQLRDGRIIEVTSDPTPDGGFVITFGDITARARAEAEAAQRSRDMQMMQDHIRHGMAMYGPDRVLRTANTLFHARCGLPAGTVLVGRHYAQVVRMQCEAGVFGSGEAALATERELNALDRSQPIRHVRQWPDGRIMEITSEPTEDGGFVICLSDVTALATAQREAQQRASVLQVMTDSMRHGIVLFDNASRVVSASAMTASLIGLPEGSLRPGVTLNELGSAQLAAGEFGESGMRPLVNGRERPDRRHAFRYTRERPNGTILEIASDPTPDGGFVVTYTDVTELSRAQAAAQQRATLLQGMLDNVQHGIAVYDMAGRLVTANHLAAFYCGLTQTEMQPGANHAELIQLQFASGAFGSGPQAEAFYHETLARDWHSPTRFQRTDSQGRVLDITVNPMPDGGYVLGWSDITPLLEAQAEAAHRASVLHVMMNNMRHGISLYDANQRLVAANGLVAQMNTAPAGPNRIGWTLRELLEEQHALGRLSATQMQRQLGLDRTRPDRAVASLPGGIVLEIRSDPTPDGGFVITHSDVTELSMARAEAQSRADVLQVMLDNMHHGIVRYDRDRRLVMANRLALELHGLEPDTNLVGMLEPDIARLLHDRGELDEAMWQASVNADITQPRRATRTRPNGMMVSFTADPTPDGGYVVTISDITDLMAAEHAARQRAAILQVMLDNIRHGICYYGPDRRVIAANALAARLGGHKTEVLAPGTLLDDLIGDQLATGAVPGPVQAIANAAMTLDRSKPARHVRPTGDGRMLEVTSDPTPDGGFVVTSTDITRLVEAETVAQSRATTLGVMLDNIRHGIVLFDARRRIVAANPRVRDILGVPEAAVRPGLHMHDYIRGLATHGVYGDDAEAMARAEATIERFDPTLPTRHVRTGLRGEIVEVVADPTPDGGFVLTYTDVTEDRRVRAELEAAREAAEGANLAKSRFLATMTHELRTPLNAVIGFSEALQTAPDPERAREYLGAIHEAGRHLLSLIDDILDVTRAETTGFQVAVGEVELPPLCEGVVRVMRAAAASGQVSLGLDLAPALPLVRADEVRLRQVLLNLLSNAVKFTPAQGSVMLSAGMEADGALVVRVRDTGIGVKPEDMPRTFQPFSQLESSLARRFPGSGLGLYLSRALAEAQGAKLTLESGPGEGTTAVLRFPPDRLVTSTPDGSLPPPMFAP